ncbi:hypothetical protein NLJ89_g5415 [Agrocybe chaxingu]|uniref:Uncharacterized protein n=1 Tax=Agrocybe chaxingu TaxID=84603 RepID=A0A9W8K8B7_9AGAR|nr:hypothetical protein NLJ89_g5415 [Agrocybe chaxingu]
MATSKSIYDAHRRDWVNLWVGAVGAEPLSREKIASRITDLLAGRTVNGVPGIRYTDNPKEMLSQFVWMMNWESKPAAFDDVWRGIFDVARARGWTEDIREQTYYWTELYLLDPAFDAQPEDEEKLEGENYDNSWISCSLGGARLFSLGYGYSYYTWSALFEGLGISKESDAISDSMRIGSCAQLLGAGRRIKLCQVGGGEDHSTPDFAGRWLAAAPMNEREDRRKTGEETWLNVMRALADQQDMAGARAAHLLEITQKHLTSDEPDLTSGEVAKIIWPESAE